MVADVASLVGMLISMSKTSTHAAAMGGQVCIKLTKHGTKPSSCQVPADEASAGLHLTWWWDRDKIAAGMTRGKWGALEGL